MLEEQKKRLRELETLGERIRSHATHLYFLALPDYLGYESALAMLPKYKRQVQSALRMMKVGNNMIRTVAGRDMHPISNTVGGYTKLPSQEELEQMYRELDSIRQDALATVRLFSGLKVPKFEKRTEYFSVSHPGEYGMLFGGIKSQSRSFEQEQFHDYVTEYHEPYSTANFVVKEGKSYMVGSLARMNNNFDFLSDNARKAADDAGLRFPIHNPFYNNHAQAIELVHHIDQAQDIIRHMKIKDEKPVHFDVRAGHGIAAIEVPRGTLWHEYTLDDKGIITYANIVTPTAQNLRNMQDDIQDFLPSVLGSGRNKVVLEVEKLIRAYDPCFSCSAHFLDVRWE